MKKKPGKKKPAKQLAKKRPAPKKPALRKAAPKKPVPKHAVKKNSVFRIWPRSETSCVGLCSREPVATVEFKGQPPVKYVDLTPEKMRKIFIKHVLGGHLVPEYALAVGSEMLY